MMIRWESADGVNKGLLLLLVGDVSKDKQPPEWITSTESESVLFFHLQRQDFR